jgi:hypothetical protein
MSSNIFTLLDSDNDSDSDYDSDSETITMTMTQNETSSDNNILKTSDQVHSDPDFNSDSFIEDFYLHFNSMFPTYYELDSALKSGLTWYDICFPTIQDHLWVTVSQKKHNNTHNTRNNARNNTRNNNTNNNNTNNNNTNNKKALRASKQNNN